MLWAAVLICVVGAVCGGEGTESKVVNIKQGPLRGLKSPDGNFFLFYGVPYATAPTGSERFKAPLPPPTWQDTFDAVEKNVMCPQNDYLGLTISKDKQRRENCLVANIYVPETNEKKLPVLVYIHGGGFISGFGELTTYKNLAMTKKVIVVTFNYRLGAHGFLCLGTKDVPGNAGMKDQVALLRWVRDNIAYFGGDANDVTIAGYSAGSSSVDMLVLSKMANGLFKKVIPESGASISTYSIQVDPLENAKKYAKYLNFSNVDDISALETFYKTASYDLLTSIDVFQATDGCFIFSPCVERDTGVERFLDESPLNILKNGNYEKRPMLYGFSEMEGMIRLNMFETWKEIINRRFIKFLPADLKFKNEDEKAHIAAKVKEFYFGTKLIDEDSILGYIDFFTDTMFAYATLLSIRLQVEAGNNQIYLYEYTFTDESSSVIPYKGTHGASHCAQTFALQDGLNLTNSNESLATNRYKSMKQILREMWLNFVVTGKPVPEGSSLPAWPPTGAKAAPYMVLDLVPELVEKPLLKKRFQFWDEIYSKYYYNPTPLKTPKMVKTEL